MHLPTSQAVLLFGATGTAGQATARALRDAGHNVMAFGRRDPEVPDVQSRIAEISDQNAILKALHDHKASAVVSCLASRTGTPADAWAIDHGANSTILRAAQAAGVGHMVLLSAICVQKPKLAFQDAKLAFEAELTQSGLTYSIVRPTAFFKSLAGQVARVKSGKPYLTFGNGTLTACKPLSDRDLGAFIAGCLSETDRQNRILPIGGPGPALNPRQMGDYLFQATGQTPRFRQVPPAMLSTIARGLDLGGIISARLKTKAELARIGHYYATESMLYWDASRATYDAAQTPETGQDTLFDYFDALLDGRATLDRGDHAVF